MGTGFGILAKLTFLQDYASTFIALLPSAVLHNLEKYYILKKVHYLSAIEDIEGDYLEFGVFTGSSFCHSIRCVKKLIPTSSNLATTRFFGFDSFEGFGKLSTDEEHPFYNDENFKTNYQNVLNRVSRVAKGFNFNLVKGYFSESLKEGPSAFGIKKSKIIFIDSDTYSSANEALTFCIPTIQEGTFIVLDDFYSYRGNERKGVAHAFNQFVNNSGIKVRQVFTYGMGGVVYVVSEKSV